MPGEQAEPVIGAPPLPGTGRVLALHCARGWGALLLAQSQGWEQAVQCSQGLWQGGFLSRGSLVGVPTVWSQGAEGNLMPKNCPFPELSLLNHSISDTSTTQVQEQTSTPSPGPVLARAHGRSVKTIFSGPAFTESGPRLGAQRSAAWTEVRGRVPSSRQELAWSLTPHVAAAQPYAGTVSLGVRTLGGGPE